MPTTNIPVVQWNPMELYLADPHFNIADPIDILLDADILMNLPLSQHHFLLDSHRKNYLSTTLSYYY